MNRRSLDGAGQRCASGHLLSASGGEGRTAIYWARRLVRQQGTTLTSSMIVETEAYEGTHDLASHSSRGRTPRIILLALQKISSLEQKTSAYLAAGKHRTRYAAMQKSSQIRKLNYLKPAAHGVGSGSWRRGPRSLSPESFASATAGEITKGPRTYDRRAHARPARNLRPWRSCPQRS